MDETTLVESPSLSIRDSRAALSKSVLPSADQSNVDIGPSSRFARLIEKMRGSLSVWGFVDQGFVSLASFVAAAIVGRVCGSVELGIYTLAVRIFWLAAGIPNALVWMPYTARSPRLNEDRRAFFLGSATVHLACIATVSCLALALVGVLPLLGLSQRDWLLPMQPITLAQSQ